MAKTKTQGRETRKRVVKPNNNSVNAFREDAAQSTETSTLKKRPSRAKSSAKTKRAKQELTDSSDEQEYIDSDHDSEASADSDASDDSDRVVKTAKVIIPRPKGAPFPDALSPDTMDFMSDLAANNSREFMRMSEKRWHAARKDFMDFIGLLSSQLAELDPTIMVEDPQKAMFRLHRDLRFTNDRRPYRTYLSAMFSRGGKKSPFAGYYIALSPGNASHVEAGIWQPSGNILARMRQGMIEQGQLMRDALELDSVKENFGASGLEALDQRDKLKVAPKDVDRNHPEIELLKFKSMFLSRKFTDLEVVSEGFLDKILDAFEAAVPFVTVLNAWTS